MKAAMPNIKSFWVISTYLQNALARKLLKCFRMRLLMRQNFYTENNNQEGYILRYTTSFHFFLLGTLFSGCASITGSEMQSVSVQTRTKGGLPVKEASCKLTNDRGIWMVTTPASLMVRKSAADMSISCEKETFE